MENREKVDVIVVGAGPAGTVAARYAALGGARVLVMDKRPEIGAPVQCGEGLAPDFFEEIDIVESPEWCRNRVKGARLISPSDHVWTIEGKYVSDEVGLVVDRDKFDRMLARRSVGSGARIWLNCCVTGIIGSGDGIAGVRYRKNGYDGELRSRVVIAADGYESRVARWSGLDTTLHPRDICTCYEYTLTGVSTKTEYCDFYFGTHRAPGGYVWIFPKGEGVANVGLGLLLSRVGSAGDPRRYLEDFISSHPDLKDASPVNTIAGCVSVSRPVECTVTNGLMVVGDAARMVDPLTGGGVANACIAAKIAGEVAAEAVRTNKSSVEFLMRYDKSWRARLEEKLYRNYMAKELLLRQSDETMDRVIEALGSTIMEDVGTYEIMAAISEKCPDVLREIEESFFK